MTKRSFTSVVYTSCILGILCLIIGGTVMQNAHGNSGSKAVEGSLIAASKTGSLAIPPIDAVAPSSFETASFGLG